MRAVVGLSLAVLNWSAFPLWRNFRLYLLMKKVRDQKIETSKTCLQYSSAEGKARTPEPRP